MRFNDEVKTHCDFNEYKTDNLYAGFILKIKSFEEYYVWGGKYWIRIK